MHQSNYASSNSIISLFDIVTNQKNLHCKNHNIVTTKVDTECQVTKNYTLLLCKTIILLPFRVFFSKW